MVYNGNDPSQTDKNPFWSKNGSNLTKIGLDHGSFGLGSDASMGGECLGTIRTIPDGILWKRSLPDCQNPFLAKNGLKNGQKCL